MKFAGAKLLQFFASFFRAADRYNFGAIYPAILQIGTFEKRLWDFGRDSNKDIVLLDTIA